MTTSDQNDRELIERANAGDSEAFAQLYQRHRQWVVALAYRFTGSRDDALDVLQDAFAYLFAKFPGFALTASVRAFLYPTVKHLCLDRRRAARPTVDVNDLADALPAADPTLGNVSDIVRLTESLPETQREIVWLRFVDDFSLPQIAAALDVPVGTVKSRLHNALATLREKLGPRR